MACIAPLAFWAASRRTVNTRRTWLMAAATAPVALMLLSAVLSETPASSIVGVSPGWQGWLLWATTLIWFWVALVGASGSDLGRVVRTLVWLGVITAGWSLLEVAGGVPTYQARDGLSAMALFDSSMSLGQVLIITVAATLSMLFRKGASARARSVLLTLAGLQLAALALSGSRAAIAGFVIGMAAWGILDRSDGPLGRAVRAGSAAVVTGFGIVFVTLMSAWAGVLGPAAYTWADNILSHRFVVWGQAGRRLGASLLMGLGPGPFDSVIEWGVAGDGGVVASLAYDQHSILVSWLTATGLLGLMVFGLAAVVLGVHIVRSVRELRSTASVRALAAAGPALFVAMLSSWPEPFALLGISVIVGALVSAGSLKHQSPEPARVEGALDFGSIHPVAIATVGLAFTLALLPGVSARVQTAYAHDYAELIDEVDAAAYSTQDGSYLAHELYLISEMGRDAASDDEALVLLTRMSREYPREATGRLEIPLWALEILWQRSSTLPREEYWRLTRFYAGKGSELDPELGIWRFALARAARVVHPVDESVYVDAALSTDLPDSAKLYITHAR